MSDQVNGPLGTVFIMIGLLIWFMEPGLQYTSGNDVSLSDFLIPLPVVVPMILIGLYFITHPYSWYPNHREERVERIRIKYDKKEE